MSGWTKHQSPIRLESLDNSRCDSLKQMCISWWRFMNQMHRPYSSDQTNSTNLVFNKIPLTITLKINNWYARFLYNMFIVRNDVSQKNNNIHYCFSTKVLKVIIQLLHKESLKNIIYQLYFLNYKITTTILWQI